MGERLKTEGLTPAEVKNKKWGLNTTAGEEAIIDKASKRLPAKDRL